MSQNVAIEPPTATEVNSRRNVEETAENMEIDEVHVAQYIEIDNTPNPTQQADQERGVIIQQQQQEFPPLVEPPVPPRPIANDQVRLVFLESPNEFRDEVKTKASKRAKALKKSPLKSPLKSPEKDDEAQCCPICFEPWSNAGSHRLSSLACGHLFGRSCIERWLKGKSATEKCPQCNAPAKRRDIRNIYAKALKTIDTSERDRAIADLEKEKTLRQKAEEAEARALMQYQLVRAECERLKMTLTQQQELVLANCSKSDTRTVGEVTSQTFTSNKCYVLQRSSQISKGGSRVMSFDEHHGLLVISKQSTNQLFPGFGIAKVSSLDVKHSEFVQIHQKAVRDACFSCQGDGLLLTAGMDKTVKLTSMLSNTVVQSYNTPVPAWSCAWNNSDTNYIYCGLQNGSCLMFDVRNTNTYLKNLLNEGDSLCPVISLAHVTADPNSHFRPGGLIVCKLGGACFWESTFGVDYVPHTLTLPEGSCTSLSFEPTTRYCMFSLRPSKNFSNTRHMVCKLQGNGIAIATARSQTEGASNEDGVASNQGSLITLSALGQCTGGSVQKLLSRSVLYTNPDNNDNLIVASPDEAAKATLLWDGKTGHQFQKLPNQSDAVLDVLPFVSNGQHFLTSITEQKLDIYRWQ